MNAPRNHTRRLAAAATAGILLLTGCWNDPSSGEGSGTSGATIEGQVVGELALAKRASAGLEGATVTAVRLKSDGSFETVSKGEVTTGVDGRFVLETTVESTHGIIVIAKKEAKEFKAVVSGEVKEGTRTLCRPLDIESSVEADVFAQVHADGKGGAVSFADIASHIDSDVAAKVEAKADGKAEAKGFLAAQLATEAETRAHVLLTSSAKATRAQIEKMDGLRLQAQADLEAALHAAAKAEGKVTADAEAKAQGELVKAHWRAVAEAGIAMGEFAKAREAAFQAMIKAHAEAQVESEVKLAWLKRIALHNAFSLEAALAEDVKASGGSESLVVEAGAALKASLTLAKTRAEIDSAFAKCRASVGAGIQAALTGALGTGIGLSDSSAARAGLLLSLKTAATAEAVAEAYVRFYAEAEAEIRAKASATLDAAKIQAAARAALLVSLQGSVKSSPVVGGFSLSGKVEGDLAGADVKLATVNADGSLKVISTVETRTTADGSFTLKTDAPVPENAVVIVTTDSSKLTALVDAKTEDVKVGSETTVETQVWQKAVIEGRTDITPLDVKTQVDSSVAATLKDNDTLMVTLLASLDAAAKAQVKFLTDSGLGLASASLVLITAARTTAQGKLEADLKAAAGDAAKVKAAYQAYHAALMEAYVKAGLDASAYARSQQVYAQALVKTSVRFTGDARVALVRSGHSQAARGLRSAMEISVKASGASETVLKAAVEAGIALQAAIDASAKVETIEDAYASYHAAVLSCLKGAFLLHAQVLGEVDAKLRAADGARAQLMAAVKGEASADALAKAHAAFAAAVEAEISAAFEGGLGAPTSAQLKVMTQALVLANMCG